LKSSIIILQIIAQYKGLRIGGGTRTIGSIFNGENAAIAKQTGKGVQTVGHPREAAFTKITARTDGRLDAAVANEEAKTLGGAVKAGERNSHVLGEDNAGQAERVAARAIHRHAASPLRQEFHFSGVFISRRAAEFDAATNPAQFQVFDHVFTLSDWWLHKFDQIPP
jgi:hypothetical protein